MVIEGIAYWASVTSPNTTYEPCYTVNLVVTADKADEMRAQGIKVVDKEEGPTVVIKRKVNGPNGMVRSAPKLLDRQRILWIARLVTARRLKYNTSLGKLTVVEPSIVDWTFKQCRLLIL